MLGWKLWSEPGMLGKGWPAGGHRLLPRCSLQRPKKGAQGCLGVPETLPLDTKTLATIMLVPPPSSCETTVAFTRVGCSHDIGHHKRLNAEASVRTHLPTKKPDIKGICKCCIMPLVTQNPFFGGCICGIVPRPGIKS